MLRHVLWTTSIVCGGLTSCGLGAIGREIVMGSAYGNFSGLSDISTVDAYDRVDPPGGWKADDRENFFLNVDGSYRVDGLAIGDADDNGVNEIYFAYHTAGIARIEAFDYAVGSGWSNQRVIWSSLEPGEYETRGLAVGDVDNDGNNEIVWGQRAGGGYYVMQQEWDGASSFTTEKTIWSNTDGYRVHGVAIADAHNNGGNELILASGFQDQYWSVDTHMWNGVTLSQIDTVYSQGDGATYKILDIAAGDTDGDGLNEVLMSSGTLGGAWQVNGRIWNGSVWGWDPEGDTPWINTGGYYIPAVTIGNAVVPEPASFVTVLLLGGGLIVRRRVR